MAYIGNSPGVASQRVVTEVTATDGQTEFTPTSGYNIGYIDVFMNGVKLINGTDFTADDGSVVTLTTGANTGDIIEMQAFIPRGLSDGYTKTEADARFMDINEETLPSQSGQAGKYLTTDGTNASWAEVDLTAFDAPVQLKNYTTTQRNALTGLESGDTIFNSTTGSIEFYNGENWVATNLIPTLNSVTGTINVGIETTLTLSITNATETVTVRFSEGGSVVADVADVTVTSGSASVSVPAAVYGQTVGDTIAVSVLNEDRTPSANAINKTVQALPTGGTVTTSGSYRVHTFTSSSSFIVPSGLTLSDVEYLVIGGGGAGGGTQASYGGGGGGAGGYRCSVVGESSGRNSSAENRLTLSPQSYTVTVGAGGPATTGVSKGSSSVFGSITSLGGGGGSVTQSVTSSSNGGSGGGGHYSNGNAGSGTSGQGFDGGRNYGSGTGGGGGGAGGTGVENSSGGDGGDGLSSSITGTSVFRAGGGGGGDRAGDSASTYGLGAIGGGGDGASDHFATNAIPGTPNTGSGGGGASRDERPNANGGSGIVIVRYQLP